MNIFGGIYVFGLGHLRETLLRAADVRGLGYQSDPARAELIFCAQDVLDHDASEVGSGLAAAHGDLTQALHLRASKEVPVVVVSQVPPGWTRTYAGGEPNVFYQVDTIIVSRAVDRMVRPEQFVVGCADPAAPLPLAYQEYFAAHGPCPVRQMSYESAELAKLAINYMLAKQIEGANDLAVAAQRIGADYADVERVLRGDARIGPHTYLRPGRTNQHLDRDVATVRKLIGGQ